MMNVYYYNKLYPLLKKVRENDIKNSKIKFICKCGKKIKDIYNPPNNFEYIACDEENNPFFKCKDCKEYVWG